MVEVLQLRGQLYSLSSPQSFVSPGCLGAASGAGLCCIGIAFRSNMITVQPYVSGL